LSQVYGFATQSGGGVTVDSQPGRGTTVTIHLPKADAGQAVSPDSAARSAAPLRGKDGETILVVEDDEDVRSYTAGSLRDLGYTVFEAVDAASALDIVAHEPAIQLIFTDLGLPGGVDGKTLSEQARARRPALRVLITTAYAAAALIHDGKLDRGIDLLVKPFTFETLAARIREVLDRPRPDADRVRILVVEDEVLIRMFLAQTLDELGCEVEDAGSAAEALDLVHTGNVRLSGAIVDLGLPDRPGEEVIKEIRLTRPALPIVLATGHADRGTRERLAYLGGVEVLEKPCTGPDIEAAFARLGLAIRSATTASRR
jgi:CheY-like chemotaxis protein